MTKFPIKTLGEICREGGGFVKTGPFGSQLHRSDYTDDPDGIPVVMPKDMIRGRIDRTSIARIDQPTAQALSQHLLAANDVVLSRRGDVGRSAWVFEDDLPAFCGTGSMRVHLGEPTDVRPEFLRFFFHTKLASNYLEGHAVGATMPNLNSGIVQGLPVPIPPMAIQDSLIEVLESFDELIENNRRRVGVLEEMARAIYREWFVKFRYPGHEDVPLIDSALGPIPEGWIARPLREVSSVVARGISPKYADEGEWVVLNQKCVRDGRVSFGPSRRQERAVSDAKRIRTGDVLINSTGVGTLGRVAMYRGPSAGVTVDSHVTISRPAEESLNPWYALSILGMQAEIERLGAGATGQTELRKTDVEALELVQPVAAVLDAFSVAVSPLLEQVDVFLTQIETLSALRDLLLPKLVTGQIEVSALDLDSLVAEEVGS